MRPRAWDEAPIRGHRGDLRRSVTLKDEGFMLMPSPCRPKPASTLSALVLAGLLACAFGTAAAPAAAPGLNVGGNFFFSNRTYHAVSQSGARYVRFFMFWQTLEPKRGHYDEFTLRAYEHAIASLPAGTRALFVVVGTPGWAGGRSNSHAPPRHPAEYASFLHYLARRFAGRVAGWEIWNEPDAPIWWTGNAAQYTALLKLSYPAVKSADPGATVVLGGLTGNNFHFLQQLYADGAKGHFDVVSDHTDTACNLNPPSRFTRDRDGRINQFSFLGYREVHAVMVANGDDKPIWLTEMGWNTSRRLCDGGKYKGKKAGGISEARQASYLARAYHCLAGDPYVQVSFWFDLQDQTSQDTSQGRFGLLRPNFTHKPSFTAFKKYAHKGDGLQGACGNFTGPRVSIASPRNGSSYTGPLPISVHAFSTAGVFEIQLRYDSSKRIRNFVSFDKKKPTVLRGFIDWMHAKHISMGRHTLSVRAIDPMGNATTRTITFIKRH
jgi:Cellulase (glycosyl hydrolase family 5)